MRRFAKRTFTAVLAAFVLGSAFSFLGRAFWAFELIAHFRPQLAMLAFGLLLAALLLRVRFAALVALGALAVHAAPLLPYLLPPVSPAAAGDTGLRVMTLNLHHRHADADAVRRLVETERPDVLLLTELTPGHAALLDRLRPLLPHHVLEPRGSPFDVALLSRWRIDRSKIERSTAWFLPILEARLCDPEAVGGVPECIGLVGLHAAPPLDARSVLRDAQLRRASALAAAQPDGRVVLLGDLNITPWSPVFADLLAVGGLQDSGLGQGLAATWRSRSPLLGLPIDHILIGAAIETRSRRIGPDIGSDHFPVIADLAIP